MDMKVEDIKVETRKVMIRPSNAKQLCAVYEMFCKEHSERIIGDC